VPNDTANLQFTERDLIEYLAAVIRDHPETHVWNISANQEGPQFDPEEVSALGSVGIQDSHSSLSMIQAFDGTIRIDRRSMGEDGAPVSG
jgi:hypothetical protein